MAELIEPTVTISGQVLSLQSGTVSGDEGQYAWTCDLQLADARQHVLFVPDAPFVVNLPGEDYAMLVDSTGLSRGGIVDLHATVSGISPSALYAAPRAQKVSQSWDTAVLATAVVDELFGVGVVAWPIVNWSIAANRLGADNQTPMEVLQRLAQTPGALVESEPDGSIQVRYRFPIAVTQYPGATPDQEYTDTQHNIASGEKTVFAEIVNRLRVLDSEAAANSDAIEFEQDKADPAKGLLRVFPKPWREPVTLVHTSNAQVSAQLVGVVTEELIETVEVLGGKGSVSKPIFEVVLLEWLFVNLTGVTFEVDGKEFTTTHATLKESLLRITYRTRSINFEAAAFLGAEVQFLVIESAAAIAALDIAVVRGAGDKPGDNIVDPLIGSVPVAIQRGRNELDARASGLREVDIEAVYRAGVRMGQLAKIFDMQTGVPWLGKISGVTHQISKAGDSTQLTTRLRVEKPTNFYAI